MKKIIQKLVLIVIMLLITLTWNSSNQKVYASTEAEQLTEMLDLYKDEMGNLQQFKSVVDQVYNDLNSATEVTDELKTKLIADIEKIAEVEDINPLISSTLVETLKGQVNSMDNETLPQMKEEILVIKQWADAQQTTTPDPEPDPTPEPEPEPETPTTQTPTTSTSTPATQVDNSTSSTYIPKAGVTSLVIVVLLSVITIVAIIAKKKYGYLKDI